MSGDKMYMSAGKPYENNFCPPDRLIKLNVVQNHAHTTFQTNQISLTIHVILKKY